MVSTPEQFAKKLGRVADNVQHQQAHAIKARADVTKKYILGAAGTRAPKQVRPAWVKVTVTNDVATLRLWGGFAHLFEQGSYHQPGGYLERAKKVTARRRRNALAKGLTINESGLMSTPYGAFPVVHHPTVRARPFWNVGIERSRKPGQAAYRKSINSAITDALR